MRGFCAFLVTYFSLQSICALAPVAKSRHSFVVEQSKVTSRPKVASSDHDSSPRVEFPFDSFPSINISDVDLVSRRHAMASLISIGLLGTIAIEDAQASENTSKREARSNALYSSSESLAAAGTDAIPTTPAVDWKAILQKSSKKALGGGKAGASAAVVQVCSLMWLRTSMNYQYRYGGDLGSSLKTLWEEGGVARLYQGLPFALVQGPATRFGDTAANVGILALLEAYPVTASLPLPVKTACGSLTAGIWRIFLMPIDSSKTALQVQGANGFSELWNEVAAKGPGPLYRGAFALAAATTVGHFPWFLTYNFLDDQIPAVSSADNLLWSLARAAVIGLSASCVSDVCSNSLRVIKTTKQTASLGKTESSPDDSPEAELSYQEVVKMIIEQDGIKGLLGRGLQTRLLTNAIQGMVFSVLWKYFQQLQG